MPLEYSSAAQNVLPVFEGTDLVVFTEGCPSCLGHDYDFWNQIFRSYCPKKVKLIPRGGKSELLKILNQEGGLPPNVYIVLDRDLEDVFSRVGERPHLIYTYGYSYENDLYSKELILDIIRLRTHLRAEEVSKIKKMLEQQIASFMKQVAPYMCAFLEGTKQGISVLPNKKKNSQFDRLFVNSRIDLNEQEVEKCITRLKTRCCKDGRHNPFGNIRYCNGHLLETFVWRVVDLHCKDRCSKLSKDDLRSMALRGFVQFLTSEVSNYYRNNLEKI